MDDPVIMILRKKYLTGGQCKKNKHAGDRSGVSRHNKLSSTAKQRLKPQPKKIMMVDGLTGHSWMVDA